MRQVFNHGNKVVSNIQCGELDLCVCNVSEKHSEKTRLLTNVIFQTFQTLYSIMAEIQLINFLEFFQPFQLGNPIRLN